MNPIIEFAVNYWYAIIPVTTTIIFGTLLLLTLLVTPAITFWKAIIFGGTTLLISRNDKRSKFVNAKVHGGLAETKNNGCFILVRDTMMNLTKGGTLGVCMEDNAITINKKLAIYTSLMKEREFNNYTEVNAFFNKYAGKVLKTEEDVNVENNQEVAENGSEEKAE